MKKEYLALFAVLVLILGVLLSFIIYNQYPLVFGKKIILATQPVDPFDPFMGQYMTINYDISFIENVSGFSPGSTVYVTLVEDSEGIWRFQDASNSKPISGDFIKGKVTSVSSNSVSVEYGIEHFFFERHANVPTENITVEVKVSPGGRAKIVHLLQNGKPVVIEYEKFDIKS